MKTTRVAKTQQAGGARDNGQNGCARPLERARIAFFGQSIRYPAFPEKSLRIGLNQSASACACKTLPRMACAKKSPDTRAMVNASAVLRCIRDQKGRAQWGDLPAFPMHKRVKTIASNAGRVIHRVESWRVRICIRPQNRHVRCLAWRFP